MLYTTVPTESDALKLVEQLVRSHLVVCANILPSHKAVYLNEGQLTTHEEVGIFMKILEDNYGFVYEAIHNLHPYSIPALLTWPVEINPSYAVWANHNRLNALSKNIS